jgi:hypothetical protein
MHTVVNQVDQFDHQTVLSNRTVDRWWGCRVYYCVLYLATRILHISMIKPEIAVVSETWTLFEEEEVCLIRIKEQVSEKRSTVCTHLLKNTPTKHNTYVVNQTKHEHVDDLSLPNTRSLYLRWPISFMKQSWLLLLQIKFMFHSPQLFLVFGYQWLSISSHFCFWYFECWL